MKLRSNQEWKQWGENDPLFGVASWANKQKGSATAWTDDEFYALGESDWRDFYQHWRQYGVDDDSCLEIGCGAGRLTRQIALAFRHVHAVDVSEAMINYARARVESQTVEFALINGIHLTQASRSVKAVFSAHVLQHLDSVEVGYSYFREVFRVLDAGGTLMVHLPLYEWPTTRSTSRYLYQTISSTAQQWDHLRAVVKRLLRLDTMRCTAYSISALHCCLSQIGYKRIELRIFPTTMNGDLHPFIFATK